MFTCKIALLIDYATWKMIINDVKHGYCAISAHISNEIKRCGSPFILTYFFSLSPISPTISQIPNKAYNFIIYCRIKIVQILQKNRKITCSSRLRILSTGSILFSPWPTTKQKKIKQKKNTRGNKKTLVEHQSGK